ncbi:MAG: hypothetical protein M1285_02335 [Candidatus Thermoplasmatota archaeon]|nr:hypothetical protein [Candidatus Thermoplasmatota archaeon]
MRRAATYLIEGIFAVLAALILAVIFIQDFRFFVMPESFVVKLYIYSSLGLVIAIAFTIAAGRIKEASMAQEKGVFHYIRIFLGFLWVIDGILQIQPEMSFGFVSFVINPAVSQSPALIGQTLRPAIELWLSHPVFLDALSGVAQIFIGMGVLAYRSGRRLRIFLWISLLWSLYLWILGEAFGGIFVKGASYLTGFPGSALIYAVISIFLISYPDTGTLKRDIAVFMAGLFTISTVLQAIPQYGFWKAENLFNIPSSLVINQQPMILSEWLRAISLSFYYNHLVWNLAFVVTMAAISILWILRPRISALLTIMFSMFVWFVGQDFGVLGGYGTDPNTALPVILLAFAFLLHERIYVRSDILQFDSSRVDQQI